MTKESRFSSWVWETNEIRHYKTIEPNKLIKVKRIKEYQNRHRETYNSEHIIHGYSYGGVFIPFSSK